MAGSVRGRRSGREETNGRDRPQCPGFVAAGERGHGVGALVARLDCLTGIRGPRATLRIPQPRIRYPSVGDRRSRAWARRDYPDVHATRQVRLDDRVGQGQVLRDPVSVRWPDRRRRPGSIPTSRCARSPTGRRRRRRARRTATGRARSWPPATSGRPRAPGRAGTTDRGRAWAPRRARTAVPVGLSARFGGHPAPSSARKRRFSARRRSTSRRSSSGLAASCSSMGEPPTDPDSRWPTGRAAARGPARRTGCEPSGGRRSGTRRGVPPCRPSALPIRP